MCVVSTVYVHVSVRRLKEDKGIFLYHFPPYPLDKSEPLLPSALKLQVCKSLFRGGCLLGICTEVLMFA